jgi:hypothetical protein
VGVTEKEQSVDADNGSNAEDSRQTAEWDKVPRLPLNRLI